MYFAVHIGFGCVEPSRDRSWRVETSPRPKANHNSAPTRSADASDPGSSSDRIVAGLCIVQVLQLLVVHHLKTKRTVVVFLTPEGRITQAISRGFARKPSSTFGPRSRLPAQLHSARHSSEGHCFEYHGMLRLKRGITTELSFSGGLLSTPRPLVWNQDRLSPF